MDLYSSNSQGGLPGLPAASLSYSALHDPLALPDFCDFDGKNDLMDCGFGFSFPELNQFGGLDLDKLDQLVRMEADLERIERLERLEVEVGSLDSDGEAAITFPPTFIGPSLGLSGWAPSDSHVESSLSHGCGVSAAMDSDSTDVVVNPLSVLPVSGNGGAGLNGGWSSLLSGQTSVTSSSTAVAPAISAVSVTSNAGAVSMVPTFSNRVLVTAHQKVPSPLPASPAPQGSPLNFPQRMVKSAAAVAAASAAASAAVNGQSALNGGQSIGPASSAAGGGAAGEAAQSGFPKPAYSYSCLIALALKNSRTGCLPVSEIYRFMCEHFPYFRTAPAGWKNSVRHNLSLNKCFEKVEKLGPSNGNGGGSAAGVQGQAGTTTNNSASTRKGCLWTLSPAKATKMDEEVLKWSRKDPSAIKRAMAYPDALELLERGEMKMDSVGGASTESEDEGEGVEEEMAECPSPMNATSTTAASSTQRVTALESSPPMETSASTGHGGVVDKDQLNLGVSIVSRLAPAITGRRPSSSSTASSAASSPASSSSSSSSSTAAAAATAASSSSSSLNNKQPKVYYSLPKFQTSTSELIIIGDARNVLESI